MKYDILKLFYYAIVSFQLIYFVDTFSITGKKLSNEKPHVEAKNGECSFDTVTVIHANRKINREH